MFDSPDAPTRYISALGMDGAPIGLLGAFDTAYAPTGHTYIASIPTGWQVHVTLLIHSQGRGVEGM